MNEPRPICHYCRQKIHTGTDAKWVHSHTKSVWCDASATTKAVPA